MSLIVLVIPAIGFFLFRIGIALVSRAAVLALCLLAVMLRIFVGAVAVAAVIAGVWLLRTLGKDPAAIVVFCLLRGRNFRLWSGIVFRIVLRRIHAEVVVVVVDHIW